MKDSNLNRRQFLKNSGKIIGALALTQFTFMGISLFKSTAKKTTNSGEAFVEAGAVNDFKPGTVTSFRAQRFFIYRHTDGGFLALSVKCTHLGCAVNWNGDKQQFICPCHASHFDILGNVLSAPAPRPLDQLPIRIEKGLLLVDADANIRRSKFSKKQLRYAS